MLNSPLDRRGKRPRRSSEPSAPLEENDILPWEVEYQEEPSRVQRLAGSVRQAWGPRRWRREAGNEPALQGRREEPEKEPQVGETANASSPPPLPPPPRAGSIPQPIHVRRKRAPTQDELDFQRSQVSSASSSTTQLPESSPEFASLKKHASQQWRLQPSSTFSSVAGSGDPFSPATPSPLGLKNQSSRPLLRASATWASSAATLPVEDSETIDADAKNGKHGGGNLTKSSTTLLDQDDVDMEKPPPSRTMSRHDALPCSGMSDLDSPGSNPYRVVFDNTSEADSMSLRRSSSIPWNDPSQLLLLSKDVTKDLSQRSLQKSRDFYRLSRRTWRDFDVRSLDRARVGRHIVACLIFIVFGLVPLMVFAFTRGHKYSLSHTPYLAYIDDCGPYGFGKYASSNGVEVLFTVDVFWGNLSYGVAKLVDTLYDAFVGFGTQAIAWCLCFRVFGDGLLRAMEVAPAPFRTFFALTLDTATYSSIWNLMADLKHHTTKRAKWRAALMAICAFWVLCIPTIFGAMTGYTPVQKAFLHTADLGLVPSSDFKYNYAMKDSSRIGIPNGQCFDTYPFGMWDQYKRQAQAHCHACDCFPNPIPRHFHPKKEDYSEKCQFCVNLYHRNPAWWEPFQNHTRLNRFWVKHYERRREKLVKMFEKQNQTCTTDAMLKINGEVRNLGQEPLNTYHAALCYRGKAYPAYMNSVYSNKGRCMQTTDNPVYAWGFSLTLTLVALIFHALWATILYSIWVDAEVHSRLVQRGYRLSEMRAVFALGSAANRELGVDDISLVRHLRGDEIEKRLREPDAGVMFGSRTDTDLPFVHEVIVESDHLKESVLKEKQEQKQEIRLRKLRSGKRKDSTSPLPLFDGR